MAAKDRIGGFRVGRLRVGALFRESSDGKWQRNGKLLRFRPILTRRPDGFMLSLVVWRYCVGVAVIW